MSRKIFDANFFVDSSIDGIKSGNYNLDTFQAQLSSNNHNLFAPSSNWKGIKPKDNLNVGFNIGTFLDDRKIAIDFDWNLSLYNKDIWDGALSIAQLDTSIDDSLDGFIKIDPDEDYTVDPMQKYNEKELLKEISDYIGNTYRGHYYVGNVQTLDLIDSVGDAEAFCRSNVLKYASRYVRKGSARKDIIKIIHYGLLLLHFNDKRETADRANAGNPTAFTVDYDK